MSNFTNGLRTMPSRFYRSSRRRNTKPRLGPKFAPTPNSQSKRKWATTNRRQRDSRARTLSRTSGDTSARSYGGPARRMSSRAVMVSLAALVPVQSIVLSSTVVYSNSVLAKPYESSLGSSGSRKASHQHLFELKHLRLRVDQTGPGRR